MKISKNQKICIVGLGYVGLPLAVAFSKKFEVIGYDINSSRVEELKRSEDRTMEVDSSTLKSANSTLSFTFEIDKAANCNIFIITVPTPLDIKNKPDLTNLIESSKTVGSVLKKKDIVIYESTVFPGVTEDFCVPQLEISSKLKFNKDFFCGYSPERINPGDKQRTVTNIKKVTSGSTPEIAKKVDNLYKKIIKAGTYLTSSIKVAEASKVIENTQRDVNIALINEIAMIFNEMKIDTNEVIEAASTKWNFIKLTPGLVGGHCISIDPYYLSFKAEEVGYRPDLILTARQINNGMGKYVATQTISHLKKTGAIIENSTALVLGITFKEDCPDMRNTKVIDIIEELTNSGVDVDVYDPWVNNEIELKSNKKGMIGNPFESDKKYNAIIIAVGHKFFNSYNVEDYKKISCKDAVIIDVKNTFDGATWTL